MNIYRKFVFLFLCCVIVNTGFASASDDIYNVEDIAVSVNGRNPVDARNAALKSGRRGGLLILFARLSIDDKIMARLSDDDVADMVRQEQVIDEKVAGNSYAATMNITFAKDFVDHILAQKKSGKTDVIEASSSRSLIFPVKILQRKNLLWESGNNWRSSVFKALDGRSDIKIPVADAENMAVVNAENFSKLHFSEMSSIVEKYNVSRVFFVIFMQDIANGKANVIVRGLNQYGSSQTKLNFVNSDKFDEQELMSQVSSKTLEYISNLQDKDFEAQTKVEKPITAEIPIAKLGDWLMIKSRLESSGFINKINIDAISCDYVRISMSVVLPQDEVASSFEKIGFALQLKAPDLYSLILK